MYVQHVSVCIDVRMYSTFYFCEFIHYILYCAHIAYPPGHGMCATIHLLSTVLNVCIVIDAQTTYMYLTVLQLLPTVVQCM